MQVIVELYAKCNDSANVEFFIDDAYQCNIHGYLPSIIPNLYRDCVNLRIDAMTGQITNWKPPSQDYIDAIKKVADLGLQYDDTPSEDTKEEINALLLFLRGE